MVNNLKVPLGPKDGLIRNWWESISPTGENISKQVVCALEYYRKTGSFITIGETCQKEYQNTSVKYVYIPEKTALYSWLKSKQDNGEKLTQVIKYVLRQSLLVVTKVKVYPLDEILLKLDTPKEVPKSRTAEEYYSYPKEIEKEEEPISEVSVTKEAEKYPIKEPEEEKEDMMSEEDEETALEYQDIFDMMVGKNTLRL